jgi:BlaI family penicillinase repressor
LQTIFIVVTSFNQTIKIVVMIKELTKAEEQIMLILWEMGEALVKDVIEKMNEPKPAYNTVSTVIRVLEGKGFVDHKAIGNTHIYFPIIKETDYKRFAFEKVMTNYFENSYQSLVSFLVKEKSLSADELNKIIQLAEKLKKDN